MSELAFAQENTDSWGKAIMLLWCEEVGRCHWHGKKADNSIPRVRRPTFLPSHTSGS